MSKLPVLILAFNRADHVAQALKAIKTYEPTRIYLACDGPRKEKTGEEKDVELTKKTMLESVDWTCEIKTLFRDQNLGCAKAVYEAITWFFNNEEYGIVCEDDIVLGRDFFLLCEELLPRYAQEERIMQIAAQNHSRRKDISNTYVYSFREDCWGWASWARAWNRMDMAMSSVPTLSVISLIKKLGVVEGVMLMRTLRKAYKNLDTFSSWAYRWYLSILVNEGVVIKPGVNLAVNIGMQGGTHYEMGDKDPYSDIEIGNIKWPLRFNDSLMIDAKQSRYERIDFFHIRLIGLKKKIRKFFR